MFLTYQFLVHTLHVKEREEALQTSNVSLPPPTPFPFNDDHLYADALQYRFYLCLYFWFCLYMHVQQVPFFIQRKLIAVVPGGSHVGSIRSSWQLHWKSSFRFVGVGVFCVHYSGNSVHHFLSQTDKANTDWSGAKGRPEYAPPPPP